ncbi:hypothetical protein EVAR_99553_1 [Eumeta japonica]|uniref:Uncharacterized protein n=1 Tax=Eumeta variegata TaxID=151549 RepID=A0A4C1YVU0_EUMVA|nr:hypothetical protein EVAR_99553_1 [Eumeta japonica]
MLRRQLDNRKVECHPRKEQTERLLTVAGYRLCTHSTAVERESGALSSIGDAIQRRKGHENNRSPYVCHQNTDWSNDTPQAKPGKNVLRSIEDVSTGSNYRHFNAKTLESPMATAKLKHYNHKISQPAYRVTRLQKGT